MSLTIGETIQQLHRALRDYIEATYHVSHPMLVEQRRRLLEEPGVIHQRPYLESTPRYRTGAAFRDLGLHPAALELFSAASRAESDSGLLHDPPYQHQATSTKASLVDGRSLVVITGRARERPSASSCRSSASWRARRSPIGRSSGPLRLSGRWSCTR